MKNRLLNCRHRLRSERGNALIELAVGMSVLTTIILGAVEFGRIAYASIEINDAAHAGAMYAAESRTYAADTANANTAATDDAPDITGVTATTTYWCKCSNGGASTCGATDCSTSRILEYVTVTTTGTITSTIYVPGLPRTYTINGLAVMRVEQ